MAFKLVVTPPDFLPHCLDFDEPHKMAAPSDVRGSVYFSHFYRITKVNMDIWRTRSYFMAIDNQQKIQLGCFTSNNLNLELRAKLIITQSHNRRRLKTTNSFVLQKCDGGVKRYGFEMIRGLYIRNLNLCRKYSASRINLFTKYSHTLFCTKKLNFWSWNTKTPCIYNICVTWVWLLSIFRTQDE